MMIMKETKYGKNIINYMKNIYDKHLEELKEFMYYFIKVSNTLFSK